MTNLYDKLIGIPWFRPELYDSARVRMNDVDRLPPTYDLWLEGAKQREEQVRREGSSARRVNVDDDLFFSFCAERNLLVDAKARVAFAMAEVARGTKVNVSDYEKPGFWAGAKWPKRRK